MKKLFLVCTVFSLILITSSTFAWESTMLAVDDASYYNQFGDAVAIDGDKAVLGAFAQPSVCFFSNESGEWTQVVRIDNVEGSDFGVSVDLDGDYAIIGARDYENVGESGAAFIYHFDGSTWVEEAILLPDDATQGDWFGNYVAISGDYAVVGAERDDVGEFDEGGSAFVFHNDGGTWTQVAHLIPSDVSERGQFGWGVSISGETVLVGSRQADQVGTDAGAGYIYTFNGSEWVEQILTASDGSGTDYFGTSVDIEGDLAIIGAPGNDEGGDNYGAAYIFYNDSGTWTQQQKLIGPEGGVMGSGYGDDVAIDDSFAMVSASWGADMNGCVYLYQYDGSEWNNLYYIAPWTDGSHTFGKTVSISGDVALVGDPKESTPVISSGCGWIIEDLPNAAGIDQPGSSDIPSEFTLLPVYPNPFNSQATITVALPVTADLEVTVLNIAGQHVETLTHSRTAAGQCSYSFNAANLPSGIYFVRAVVPGRLASTQKIMLLK